MLSEAVRIIKACEGKSIAIIQDEIGYAMGRRGKSAVERWRKGHLPPTLEDREILAQLLVERSCGHLDQEWVQAFLTSANHPQPGKIAHYLFPDRAAEKQTGASALKNPPAATTTPLFLAPTQLPTVMVGRQKELAEIKTAFLQGERAVSLTGLPGVGKTTLAAALAHDPEIWDYFADGILWAGLGRNASAATSLSNWAFALGFSEKELQENVTAQLQAALGMRRMLIVIDDVWDVETAVLLRLGGPKCAFLYTTRLPAVALDLAGNHVIRLNELTSQESLELLHKLTYRALDHHSVQSLVDACGGLPLALTIIGHYLRRASYTGQIRRVSTALKQVLNPQERVSLRHGGERQTLRTVITSSIEHLPANTRQALHALAVFPPKPNSFSESAALRVACMEVDVLDQLVDAGLVEVEAGQRYRLHQCVADVVWQDAAPEARQTARSQLVDFYARHAPELPDTENLLWALDAATQTPAQFLTEIIQLAPFLERYGLYAQADEYLARAEPVATGEQLATVLYQRGSLAWRRGDSNGAEKKFRHTLSLRPEMPACYRGLGVIALTRGEHGAAKAYFEQALRFARQGTENDPLLIGRILVDMGTQAVLTGDLETAATYFSESLQQLLPHAPNSESIAAWSNLGVAAVRKGDRAQAMACFEKALGQARQLGHRENRISLLTNLGALAAEEEDFETAVSYFEEGLNLAREVGFKQRIHQLMANLGSVYIDINRLDEAITILEEGLEQTRGLDHQLNLLLLLANLGEAYTLAGRYQEALSLLDEAHPLCTPGVHQPYLDLIACCRGQAWHALGEADKARASFKQVTTASGKHATIARRMLACLG